MTELAAQSEYRKGLLYGALSYLSWGFLPIYLYFTRPASPVEVVAARVIFSLVVCVLILAALRQLKDATDLLKDFALLRIVAIASVFVMANWSIYTYLASVDNLIEGSLGYFINPIISVLLGVIFLKERLRPLQWIAISLCAAAVAVLAFAYGQVPWLGLSLAVTFGLYSLIKTQVNRRTTAIASLTVETALMAPLGIIAVIWLASRGEATFLELGAAHFWVLALGGVVTVLPLLLFGAAAGRLPLTMIGLLQFLSPIVIFLIAVLVFREPMPAERWIGFFLVWGALLIFLFDMLFHQRKPFMRSARLRV